MSGVVRWCAATAAACLAQVWTAAWCHELLNGQQWWHLPATLTLTFTATGAAFALVMFVMKGKR